MAEKMTLDRLETLLETLEPEQIRARHAEALTPECERLLTVYEDLDADLVAVAHSDPAPEFRKRVPGILPTTMRLLPLAAVLLVALLIWQTGLPETPPVPETREKTAIAADAEDEAHAPNLERAVPVTGEALTVPLAEEALDVADERMPEPDNEPLMRVVAPEPETMEAEPDPDFEDRDLSTPSGSRVGLTEMTGPVPERRAERQSAARSNRGGHQMISSLDLMPLESGPLDTWLASFQSWPENEAAPAGMFADDAVLDWSVPHEGRGKPPLEPLSRLGRTENTFSLLFSYRLEDTDVTLFLSFDEAGLCTRVSPEPPPGQ